MKEKNLQLADELHEKGNEKQEKFMSTLLSISLGSLALSFQFSTSHGRECFWLLFLGWLLIFISALLGGWRMMYTAPILWNTAAIYREKYNLYAYQTGPVRDQYGNDWTHEQYEEAISKTSNKLNTAQKKYNRMNKLASFLFDIQVYCLIFGLLGIGLFTGVNFYKKASGLEITKTHEKQ